MAQLLAPYNNSMRLGQGFNSYTQQSCLDKAVSRDNQANRVHLPKQAVTNPSKNTVSAGNHDHSVKSIDSSSDEGQIGSGEDVLSSQEPSQSEGSTKPQAAQSVTVHPWVKPQIVTYHSHFFDKLSDVTGRLRQCPQKL